MKNQHKKLNSYINIIKFLESIPEGEAQEEYNKYINDYLYNLDNTQLNKCDKILANSTLSEFIQNDLESLIELEELNENQLAMSTEILRDNSWKEDINGDIFKLIKLTEKSIKDGKIPSLTELSQNLENYKTILSQNRRLNLAIHGLSEKELKKVLEEFFSSEKIREFIQIYPEHLEQLLSLDTKERDNYLNRNISGLSAVQIIAVDAFTYDTDYDYSMPERIPIIVLGTNLDCRLRTERSKKLTFTEENSYLNNTLKKLEQNIAFDDLLKVIALESLQRRDFPALIVQTKKSRSFTRGGGCYSFSSKNIFLFNNSILLAHELTHRTMDVLNNYQDTTPYPSNASAEEIAIFQNVVNKTNEAIKNTQDNIPIPLQELFTHPVFKTLPTNHIEYHSEYVVTLTNFLEICPELPPHVEEVLRPLVLYYKDHITPKLQKYIKENQPAFFSNILKPSNKDKYYPETVLSYSGEDHLLQADPKILTPEEQNLRTNIRILDKLIERGSSTKVIKLIEKNKDERILRSSLKSTIIHGNLELFNEVLQHSQAPQYLGPQLLEAANQGQWEMFSKLLPNINNQYYLAKSIEISMNKDEKSMSETIQKIKNPTFLISSFKKLQERFKITQNSKTIDKFIEESLSTNAIDNRYKKFIQSSQNLDDKITRLNIILKLYDQSNGDIAFHRIPNYSELKVKPTEYAKLLHTELSNAHKEIKEEYSQNSRNSLSISNQEEQLSSSSRENKIPSFELCITPEVSRAVGGAIASGLFYAFNKLSPLKNHPVLERVSEIALTSSAITLGHILVENGLKPLARSLNNFTKRTKNQKDKSQI